MQKISQSEQEIMVYIWDNDSPVVLKNIVDHFALSRSWSKSTTHTLLSRLVGKGYLSLTKDKTNFYTPIIDRGEYSALQSTSALEGLYQGSVKNFLAAFYGGNPLPKKDIEELKEFIKQYDEVEKDE